MDPVPVSKQVFVNRTLNLNSIRLIGFDMDYTLVTYNVPHFEQKAYDIAIEKLIKNKGYPDEIRSLKFDPEFIIRGLVIDSETGNVLKINQYGYVKRASHGTRFMSYEEQKAAYTPGIIDLGDSRYYIIHTLFSLAEGCLFANVTDYFREKGILRSFRTLFSDIRKSVDDAHQEESLKGDVIKYPNEYLIKDPEIVEALKKFKSAGKKLALITNSDYDYSRQVMDYCFESFLSHPWQDLFDLIVVTSNKPAFFQQQGKFLKVNRDTGLLSNFHGPITWGGIYQGGNAAVIERDLNLNSSEILYLGDHILGDVVTLKEAIGWRSGLVVQELAKEIPILHETLELRSRIMNKMKEKEALEDRLFRIREIMINGSAGCEKRDLELEREEIRLSIETLDTTLSDLIKEEQSGFNPYWGEIMRSGNEESRFAMLVERYACIYMSSIGNLAHYSPFKFFRSHRRFLAHDPQMANE